MWDHWSQAHSSEGQPNHEEANKFSILSKHRDPFERQITETVRIERVLEALLGKDGKGNRYQKSQ